MKSHSTPNRPPSAFTLVELLVVIVIIASLAALSLVGFSRMRAAGNGATTVANLRQLQLANASYASDHNDRFVSYSNTDPNGGIVYWYRNYDFVALLTGNQSLIGATVGSVDESKIVQESLLDPMAVRAKKTWWNRLAASYGMNHEFIKVTKYADNSSEKFIQTGKLTNPGRTAVFVTVTDSAAKYAGRNLWWSLPVEGKTTDGKMAFRHSKKAVVVYFDGSSGFITKQDIARFDANGGQANPFWNGTY